MTTKELLEIMRSAKSAVVDPTKHYGTPPNLEDAISADKTNIFWQRALCLTPDL